MLKHSWEWINSPKGFEDICYWNSFNLEASAKVGLSYAVILILSLMGNWLANCGSRFQGNEPTLGMFRCSFCAHRCFSQGNRNTLRPLWMIHRWVLWRSTLQSDVHADLVYWKPMVFRSSIQTKSTEVKRPFIEKVFANYFDTWL